jgi:SAM-dependent methyltransferase
MSENSIQDLLLDLGICTTESIEPYFPHVRDRNDVGVLKCNKSGVLFLSRSDHISPSHYNDSDSLSYWSANDRATAIKHGKEDLDRRAALLRPIVENAIWLDVGTGSGGLLDELASLTTRCSAIEPQPAARNTLINLGYDVYPSIQDTPDLGFDVVTLFHVFEHFTEPLGELKALYSRMAPNAQIIMEVPHAQDFLISFLELESFKEFTFWSEHLILHTRLSLQRFLEQAGFTDIVISGCQRYSLANHLHWLAMNEPGGHEKWGFLGSPALDSAYAEILCQHNMSDTLIARATKL